MASKLQDHLSALIDGMTGQSEIGVGVFDFLKSKVADQWEDPDVVDVKLTPYAIPLLVKATVISFFKQEVKDPRFDKLYADFKKNYFDTLHQARSKQGNYNEARWKILLLRRAGLAPQD